MKNVQIPAVKFAAVVSWAFFISHVIWNALIYTVIDKDE
jgi:hypothetical protein